MLGKIAKGGGMSSFFARLLIPAILSATGFAQSRGGINVWIPHGPNGGATGRPVVDPQNPSTLYINAGPLLKSTDAAGHWSQIGASPGIVLAVDPQNSNILYGSGPSKSTDGGLTWKSAAAGIPTQCLSYPALAIDPSNSSTIYTGCGPWGIFKSVDSGATWNSANTGLPVG